MATAMAKPTRHKPTQTVSAMASLNTNFFRAPAPTIRPAPKKKLNFGHERTPHRRTGEGLGTFELCDQFLLGALDSEVHRVNEALEDILGK